MRPPLTPTRRAELEHVLDQRELIQELRPVVGDRRPDRIGLHRTAFDHPFEVLPAAVDLDLEVARAHADAPGELGHHAPAEVLEDIVGRIPGREHCGPEALDVAVDVAGDGPEMVGRDDPAPAVVERPQDEDDAQVR